MTRVHITPIVFSPNMLYLHMIMIYTILYLI